MVVLIVGILGARFFLGALLLIAGTSKFFRFAAFKDAIAAYGLVPARFASPLSRTIPFVEVATGLFLTLGFLVGAALVLAAGLLLVFSMAMTINLVKGSRIPCGCLGARNQISWGLVVRNLALVGLAIASALRVPAALSLGKTGSETGVDMTDALAAPILGVLALVGLQLLAEIRRFIRSQARVTQVASTLGIGRE
jgi:uncharacterized membrane protein YphA (DoxX/SURF4 family)